MKKPNILTMVGIGIYVIMSLIDRFIYSIPDVIYIPVLIGGVVLIIIGFLKSKSNR